MLAPGHLLVYYYYLCIQQKQDDLRFLKWIKYRHNEHNVCFHTSNWIRNPVVFLWKKNVILLCWMSIKCVQRIVSRLFLHPGGNCVGVASLTFIAPLHLISLLISWYRSRCVRQACACAYVLPFSLLLQPFKMYNE